MTRPHRDHLMTAAVHRGFLTRLTEAAVFVAGAAVLYGLFVVMP